MNDLPAPTRSDELNAYIDGTLDAFSRRQVEAAIAQDQDLASELAELRATRQLLAGMPELAPRRSFALGAEYARPAHAPARPAPGKIVRLLPVIRALSVAAVLVFMVVGGALFMDINGDTLNDSADTFERQNAIMAEQGETESTGGASDHAEDADASEDPAPAAAHEGSSITERGDSASAGDDPLDDLTEQESAASESSETEPAATELAAPADHSTWKWVSAGVGAVALALGGLWFILAQAGRRSVGHE